MREKAALKFERDAQTALLNAEREVRLAIYTGMRIALEEYERILAGELDPRTREQFETQKRQTEILIDATE